MTKLNCMFNRAALIASQEATYAEKLEELKLVSGLKNRLEDRLNVICSVEAKG